MHDASQGKTTADHGWIGGLYAEHQFVVQDGIRRQQRAVRD